MINNQCPHPGCVRAKPREQYACKTHWYSIPPKLRAKISYTWKRKDMHKWMEADKEARDFWKADTMQRSLEL